MPQALALRSPEELEREIAERKRVEEALRLAKARLDLAVRGSNIGIWEIDMPDGDPPDRPGGLHERLGALGYDRPELPHDFAARMTLVHPDDRERLEQAIKAYLAGETARAGSRAPGPAQGRVVPLDADARRGHARRRRADRSA